MVIGEIIIQVDYKLRGYNQLKKRWRWTAKKIQSDCLYLMQITGLLPHLYIMSHAAEDAGKKLFLAIEYGSPRAMDADNALLGANKMFIDPLVRVETLVGDEPRRLSQHIEKHHKTAKGHEWVRLTFKKGPSDG